MLFRPAFLVLTIVGGLTSGCSAAPADEATTDDDSAALTANDPSAALADALSGGAFRCVRTDGEAFAVTFAPGAPLRGNAGTIARWQAQATWSGHFGPRATSGGALMGWLPRSRSATGHTNHDFATSNGWIDAMDLSVTRSAVGATSVGCTIVWTSLFHGNPDYGNALRFFGHLERASNECFEEAAYLAANSDVAAAVAGGAFLSGRHHFELHGRGEGRNGCP